MGKNVHLTLNRLIENFKWTWVKKGIIDTYYLPFGKYLDVCLPLIVIQRKILQNLQLIVLKDFFVVFIITITTRVVGFVRIFFI